MSVVPALFPSSVNLPVPEKVLSTLVTQSGLLAAHLRKEKVVVDRQSRLVLGPEKFRLKIFSSDLSATCS